MASFGEEDEDLKADELPSDEEGDPMTGKQPILAADPIEPSVPTQLVTKLSTHSSKHKPSKSMPVSLPQFWTCTLCTFAENSLDSPMCGVCGSLPGGFIHALQHNQQAHQQQSDDVSQSQSPSSHHHRAVSVQVAQRSQDSRHDPPPSFLKQHSITNLVVKNEAIGVMRGISETDKALILKQISKISSKKELQIELLNVKTTLEKKTKSHHTRILALNKQLSKLKSEHERQRNLWDKYYIVVLQKLCQAYFQKLFALIQTRISIEQAYLQCFELKLKKCVVAYDKLDAVQTEWALSDTQQYLQNTMFEIAKIRTLPELRTKTESVAQMKISIAKMEKRYEAQKELLNTAKIEHKKRTAQIILFLKRVIDTYNAGQQNIKLTATHFCKAAVQEDFNSFLLDQRVDVGVIVRNWLSFLLQNIEKEIILKDVYIFMERLLNTFCKLYGLEQGNGKYNYREYVKRFVYVAVLNLDEVHQMLHRIVATDAGRKESQKMATLAEYALFVHLLKLKYQL